MCAVRMYARAVCMCALFVCIQELFVYVRAVCLCALFVCMQELFVYVRAVCLCVQLVLNFEIQTIAQYSCRIGYDSISWLV